MRLPLAAQLHYQAALSQAEAGDVDQAILHLHESIKLDPHYPDAYFTLAKLGFRRFDTDALYHLVMGCQAVLKNFAVQSLLVLNASLFAALLLVMLTVAVCFSFAIRYLPFLAHRIAEILKNRFNAALPRLTAYTVILTPFILFPGIVTGVCLIVLMTWYFMRWREQLVLVSLMTPLLLLGALSPQVKQLNPLADPMSFTHLASIASTSAGDTRLLAAIRGSRAPSLEADKHVALGLLTLRQEEFDRAASHFLRAIEIRPSSVEGYINLGNVYYLEGLYEKALEGYRKAAQIDDGDAVGQYNLAQAYIKTLMLAESSTALRKASACGVDDVKQSYADIALRQVQVYPKTFSNPALWRIARTESEAYAQAFLNHVLRPVTGTPGNSGAWLLAGVFLTVLILSRLFKNHHLSFQCSNCGEITCNDCCHDPGNMILCAPCADTIAGVSSDKVVEALLRQRRQAVIVKRRKAVRFVTMWIPGVRDIFYGRLTRGIALSIVFSLSLILLWSKGFIVKDWNSLVVSVPLWKWVLPATGVAVTYAVSLLSKHYREVRSYRIAAGRQANVDETEKAAGEFLRGKASA